MIIISSTGILQRALDKFRVLDSATWIFHFKAHFTQTDPSAGLLHLEQILDACRPRLGFLQTFLWVDQSKFWQVLLQYSFPHLQVLSEPGAAHTVHTSATEELSNSSLDIADSTLERDTVAWGAESADPVTDISDNAGPFDSAA
jgi:hypothetical protein